VRFDIELGSLQMGDLLNGTNINDRRVFSDRLVKAAHIRGQHLIRLGRREEEYQTKRMQDEAPPYHNLGLKHAARFWLHRDPNSFDSQR
jgi:hypothetical protein